MFLVGIFLVIEFFLILGAAVFALSAAIPATRRYALSAALWCACWGPCMLAFALLAGLSAAALSFLPKLQGRPQSLAMPSASWFIYLVFAILVTLGIASALAVLHQWLIERMTLALFRLYCMGVLCGIGGTIWLGLSFSLAGQPDIPSRLTIGLTTLLLLPLAGGYTGFRWAGHLRGKRPETLQWITPEEFSPNPNSH